MLPMRGQGDRMHNLQLALGLIPSAMLHVHECFCKRCLLCSQFPYVDAVLKEALRMEPPAGFGTLRELREVGAQRFASEFVFSRGLARLRGLHPSWPFDAPRRSAMLRTETWSQTRSASSRQSAVCTMLTFLSPCAPLIGAEASSCD